MGVVEKGMQGWDAGMEWLNTDPISHPGQERLLHPSFPPSLHPGAEIRSLLPWLRGDSAQTRRLQLGRETGERQGGMGARREMPESERSSARVTSPGMSGRGKDSESLAMVS